MEQMTQFAVTVFLIFYTINLLDAANIYAKKFELDSDNYKRRTVTNWGGPLEADHCQVYCGCQGYAFAYVNEQDNFDIDLAECWCGDDLPEEACEDMCDPLETLLKYDAGGLSSAMADGIASSVMFEDLVEVTALPLTENAANFIYNNRVVNASAPFATLLFPAPGNYTVFAEWNGYLECPSEAVTVVVADNVTAKVNTPRQVWHEDATFSGTAEVGGTDVAKVKITAYDAMDPATLLYTAEYTPAAGSLYLLVGGVMEDDRHYEYEDREMELSYLAFSYNNEVLEDGDVISFEASFTVPGEVTFVIMELFCDGEGEKVDFARKTCTTEDTGTDNPREYRASEEEVVFYASSMTYAKPNENPVCQANIDAKLRVVYTHTVSTTKTGNVVFTVPKEERFRAQVGQILGWVPSPDNPARIKRYEQPETKYYRTIYVDEFYSTEVGCIVTKDSVAVVENFEHMVAMHVDSPAIYDFTINKLATLGEMIVATEVFSSSDLTIPAAFASKSVFFVGPLVDLMLDPLPMAVAVTDIYELGYSLTTGMEDIAMKMWWNEIPFSNKVVWEDFQSAAMLPITHVFNSTGTYEVTAMAYNHFRNLSQKFNVTVYGTIYEPVFVDEEGELIEHTQWLIYNESLTVCAKFTGNELVTVTYHMNKTKSPGDEEIIEDVFDIMLGEHTILCFEGPAAGTYELNTLMVSLANANSTVSSTVYIESLLPITCDSETGLYLVTNGYLSYPIEMNGTQDICDIDWDNGTITQHVQSRMNDHLPLELGLQYEKPMDYFPEIICHNKRSMCNYTVTIYIQDFPFCNITSDPIEEGQPARTTFWCIGTSMNILGVFNHTEVSSTAPNINSNVTRNISIPHEPIGVYAAIRRHNLLVGEYDVCGNVSNQVGIMQKCTKQYVEKQLTFSGSETHLSTNKSIKTGFEIGDEITVIALSNYTGTEYHFDFGDNSTDITNLETAKLSGTKVNCVNHTYTYASTFLINVTGLNRISFDQFAILVTIYEPFDNPVNFTILAEDPVNVTEPMTLQLSMAMGSWFNCTVLYGDGGEKDVQQGHFTTGIIDISHSYNDVGVFTVQAFCKNRKMTFNATRPVIVQNPVNKPDFTIESLCPTVPGGAHTELVKPVMVGIVPYFRSDCSLHICTMEQAGTNTSIHTTMLTGGITSEQTGGNCTIHAPDFLSGKSEYSINIAINTSNLVSHVSVYKDVKVVESPLPPVVAILNESPNDASISVPADLSIEYVNSPGEACVTIDLGIRPRIMYQGLMLYGAENCKLDPQFSEYKYEGEDLSPIQGVYTFQHQYSVSGEYTIRVSIVNALSSAFTDLLIKVLDFPCAPPDLSFLSPVGKTMDEAMVAAQFRKCEPLELKFQLTLNCSRPNSTLSRTIRIVRVDNTSKEIEDPQYEGSATSFKIDNNLPYGTYKLDFFGEMVDVYNNAITVPDTQAQIIGYFIINPCALKIGISQGNGITAKSGDKVYLNASASVDPDDPLNEEGDLVFEWFMARCERSFAVDTDYASLPPLIPPSAAETVFPSDTGVYGGNSPKVGKLADKGQSGAILTIDTSFTGPGCFEVRLQLTKMDDPAKRVVFSAVEINLVFGDPIQPQITCALNCLGKLIPNQKLTLKSTIINEAECTSDATYKWVVYQQPVAVPTAPYVSIVDELLAKNASTTLFGQKTLVVLKATFNTSFTYKFKLYASCESLVDGSMEIVKTVNEAPNILKASGEVKPEFGTAMDTEFTVTVQGVQDEDLPLNYKFFFDCGKGWKDWTLPVGVFPVKQVGLKLPCTDKVAGCLCKVKATVKDSYGMESDPMYLNAPSVDLPAAMKKDGRKRRETNDGAVKLTPEEETIQTGAAICVAVKSEAVQNDQYKLSNYMTVIKEMLEVLPKTSTEVCDSAVAESLGAIVVDTPEAAMGLLANIALPPDPEESTDGDGTDGESSGGTAEEKKEDTSAATSKMLDTMSNALAVLDNLSPEALNEFAQKIMATTAALTKNIDGAAAAEAVSKAMEMEAQVAAAGASKMEVGEPPQSIVTATGFTQMQCLDSSAPGGAGAFAFGNLEPPDPSGACSGAVNSEGANRFAYDKGSADNIKGPVLGFSLSDKSGKAKVIANLTEPVELVIPNTEAPLPVKNFSAYCELMRDVHRIDAKVNASVIIVQTRPANESFNGKLFVFLNKGSAPSLVEHHQNCTLPNAEPTHWNNMSTAEQQMWEEEFKWRCYLDERELNGTAIGVWCVGVIYFTEERGIAHQLKPLSTPADEDNCTAPVEYYFQAYTRSCLYWSKQLKAWDSEGCMSIEEKTDIDKTTCACNHLTDFGGGGPFADMEPLDLAGTLRTASIAENPAVFTAVMVIFALYLILLLWARKNDKNDIRKSQVVELADNHSADSYYYEVSVETGFHQGCSSTADVVVVLTGENGESAPRRLYSKTRDCFQRGETDIFLVAVPSSLGKLQEIDVWHNNAGASPGWFCIQISVRNIQTEEIDDFICNQWLDVAEDDGSIIRKLKPAQRSDLEDFSFLFAITTRRNLYDGHIWLSVITKPVQSTYTRCQRLTTCLSLLMMTMLSDVMFYRGDTGIPSEMIELGPLRFSVDEVKVALTSALMVFPINLLTIFLFKQAGPKRDKNAEKYNEEEENEDELVQEALETEKEEKVRTHNSRLKFLRSILFQGVADDREARMRKRRNPMPHWLIYLAYALAFITCLVCAFFVILYSFAFGKIKAEKWMVAMMFALILSIFVIETLKVVFLSIVFALLIKSQPVQGNNGRNQKMKKKAEDGGGDVIEELQMELNKYKPPEERKLKEARQERMKEKRIKIIMKEVLVHLAFVILVIVVAYSAADPNSYRLYASVIQLSADNGITNDYYEGKAYVKGDNNREVKTAAEITTRLEWWDWMRYSVVEYLFSDGWYNKRMNPDWGVPDYPEGMVADAASSKVLAMARIRQLRVNLNSCTKHPVFKHLIVECNAGYSWTSEASESYRAGWLPAYNYTERLRRRRGKRKAMWKGLEDPWMYQNTSILKNPFPFSGKFNTYGGSAYSVSIGPNKQVAKKIIKTAKKDFWVDRYTRALFTEINIYNANTNLMLIVTLLHEILPTGGWNFYSNVQALRLYRYVGGLGDLILLFDIIFITVTLVGIYKAAKAIKRDGMGAYVSNPWNTLHLIVTVCSVTSIAFTLGRMLAVKQAVAQYYEEPELFVSFQFVGALEYLIIGSLGFVLFFTNLEFLRILRFNHQIAMLSKTIGIMGGPLSSFAMIFMILFMAYVSFAHCIYVDKLEEFQSVMSSFVSLTKMFMGKFDVHAYFDNAPFFGPLMFASYMLSIQMIMINLFVGVICDAFAEVAEAEEDEEEEEGGDDNVMSFMATRVKNLASGEDSKPDPIYVDWRDEWDAMIEGFGERCDNCVYLMRNMEGEETRHDKFFKQGDRKKNKLIAAVLGLDCFTYENELCDGLNAIEKRMKELNENDVEACLKNAVQLRDQIVNTQAFLDDSDSDISYDSDVISDGEETVRNRRRIRSRICSASSRRPSPSIADVNLLSLPMAFIGKEK